MHDGNFSRDPSLSVMFPDAWSWIQNRSYHEMCILKGFQGMVVVGLDDTKFPAFTALRKKVYFGLRLMCLLSPTSFWGGITSKCEEADKSS